MPIVEGNEVETTTVSGECGEEESESDEESVPRDAGLSILPYIEKRIMKTQFSKEARSVRRLSILREDEKDLNNDQERFFEYYKNFTGEIEVGLKSLQSLQDKREIVVKHLSRLQLQLTSLRSKIMAEEDRLQEIRTEANASRAWFLSNVLQAKDCYGKELVGLLQSANAKREKVAAQFKRLKKTLESERAKRLKLETDMALSGSNLPLQK